MRAGKCSEGGCMVGKVGKEEQRDWGVGGECSLWDLGCLLYFFNSWRGRGG